MALVNKGYTATTSWAALFTVPDGQTARVTQVQAAGVVSEGTDAATLDLRWKDTSGATTHALITGLLVPRGTAISCVTGELILEEEDQLEAKASASNAIELTFGAELI